MSSIRFVILAFVLFFASFVAACSGSDTTYTNFTSKIINIESSTVNVKHQVGGSVKIISGCTFQVRNATLIPTATSAYWYGIPMANNSDYLPRVVLAALPSYNGQTITFTLDSQYSFSDIAVMIMWGENDNRAYGAFAVNRPVTDYFNGSGSSTIGNTGDPTNPFDVSSGTKMGQNDFLAYYWGQIVTMVLTMYLLF